VSLFWRFSDHVSPLPVDLFRHLREHAALHAANLPHEILPSVIGVFGYLLESGMVQRRR
jgi:hypothetical protein